MSLSVAVVTPTIGKSTLLRALRSISDQSYPCKHYVFVDGKNFFDQADRLIAASCPLNCSVIRLPDNIGKGFYGHRVYAASPFLVNEDIVCFLDEDNWFDRDHVKDLVNTITTNGVPWAYSLRKIYDVHGTYLCNDDCESLGKWPVWTNKEAFHVDTSCFAVTRDLLLKTSYSWYGRWGADRQFFSHLKSINGGNFETTGRYTLCYRLGGNTGSVSSEFFLRGNIEQKKSLGADFPWIRR